MALVWLPIHLLVLLGLVRVLLLHGPCPYRLLLGVLVGHLRSTIIRHLLQTSLSHLRLLILELLLLHVAYILHVVVHRGGGGVVRHVEATLQHRRGQLLLQSTSWEGRLLLGILLHEAGEEVLMTRMYKISHQFLILIIRLYRTFHRRSCYLLEIANNGRSTSRVSHVWRMHHVERLLEEGGLMPYLRTLVEESYWRHLLLLTEHERSLVVHEGSVVTSAARACRVLLWSGASTLRRQVRHRVISTLLQRRYVVWLLKGRRVLLRLRVQLLEASEVVLVMLLEINDNQ